MGKSQREKGKIGERELRDRFNAAGYSTRRGQQYSGASGDADVVGLPGIHVECKRTDKFRIRKALEQAFSDSSASRQKGNVVLSPDGEGRDILPAVFQRGDRQDWIVVMGLDDWLRMYKSYHEKIK